MSDREFENLFGNPVPSGPSQPGPSGSGPLNPPRDQDDHSPGSPPSLDMAATDNRLVQDGGAGLIKFLLSCAVNYGCTSSLPHQQSGILPNVKNVREWHFKDLMRLPKAALEEWNTACRQELDMLRQRNVFKLTNPPKGRKIIGSRWVFDIKTDGRKRARLVAQGFSQVEGVDFNELFSPVVHFESVRLIFALSALSNWDMTAVDVKSAYLYGKLDEEIYMRQPEGFTVRGMENRDCNGLPAGFSYLFCIW